MSVVRDRLIKIVEEMPDYDDPMELLHDMCIKYLEIYGYPDEEDKNN